MDQECKNASCIKLHAGMQFFATAAFRRKNLKNRSKGIIAQEDLIRALVDLGFAHDGGVRFWVFRLHQLLSLHLRQGCSPNVMNDHTDGFNVVLFYRQANVGAR